MKQFFISLVFISLATLFCFCVANANENRVSVVYAPDAQSASSDYIERLRRDSFVTDTLAFVNETIPFSESVTLRIGANDGPLFNPLINEIWIPGDFLLEIDERFSTAELAITNNERTDAIQDVLLHTLLHELAHTVIAQFNIPTLGKEEDAADNLANVLLLEYFDDGDLIALNAADMFALEDSDVDAFEKADFWDEHSLDIQRYYTTLCHIYGARPDDNEQLVESGELSADKASHCTDEYEQVRADWLFVLDNLTE